MKKRTFHLFLFAFLLTLTSCSSVPLSQSDGARIHRELPEGCVSVEEFNYLTGVWNSGQENLALEIPLCKATSHLLKQNKKNTFTVIGLDGRENAAEEGDTFLASPPKDHELHTYAGYTLCYRESFELSEWVAYSLTKSKLEHKVTGRTNDFRRDTLITTGSATPEDYKKSGYDRGHLAPAADMEWSLKSAHDSFLMSNMSPQVPAFNRVIWKLLEEEVRRWASEYKLIYVVTGPVLEKEAEDYNAIGENQVAVPEYFYKALLIFVPVYAQGSSDEIEAYNVQCAGFIVPNKASGKDIYKFICSIDQVEERCGLDFFSNLPDEVEDLAESECGEIFLGQ